MRFLPLLLALALVGCADEETRPEPVRKGVNNVLAACQMRAQWSKKTSSDCIVCSSSVLLQPCGCEKVQAFEAACVDLANAERSEPSCTAQINACVDACADCGCVDACYDQAPACRAATAARDGCVVDVCSAYCQ